ncbi:MAG TPA: proline-rich domain-containing protein [Roseiarcus sp.]
MSDTSGATDLDSDMPGIGAAPGNARGAPVGLPSQLQGLVQHFFQTSQGKPNPKFLPPAPGQGQGQGKPPKLGPVDPPDRGAYALAPVPANAPRTPPAFTPYIPPVPRDHTQWGQPEPFPRLPQSFEVPGMYQNLGGYFAQHGGFASAPAAAGLAAYSAAYQDAYQKGQEQKMRMSLEQMKLHAAQVEELETQKSTRYADTYNMYVGKGGDLATQTINGVDLRGAIWRNAVEMGDKDTIAMMEDGQSVEKIMRQQAAHEAHIRALSAANTKTADQDAQDAQYGLAPARAATNTDPWDRDFGSQPGGAAPAAPSQPAKPGETPGRAKNVGDPLKPEQDQGEQPDSRDDNQKLIDAGAWDMVEGSKPSGAEYGKMTSTIMAKRKLEMENSLRDIAANPNLNRDGQHPEEVLDAVRKAVPEAAEKLDAYSHYRDGPGIGGRSSSGGPEASMWGLFNPLAAKMFPGEKGTGVGAFSGDNFTKRIRFADNTQYQTTLRRVATSAEMGAGVVAAANNLPPEASDPNVFKRAMKQAMDEGTGDERYVALANATKRYQSEMNVVIRGGVGGQGETLENIRTINPIFSTPANYRTVVAQDAQMAQASVNQFKHQYRQMGGGPMPGLDPDAEEQLSNLANMEPVHQVQPGATIPGKEWPDGKARVWLGPFDAKGRLRQNPDDNWDMAK